MWEELRFGLHAQLVSCLLLVQRQRYTKGNPSRYAIHSKDIAWTDWIVPQRSYVDSSGGENITSLYHFKYSYH